MTALSPATAANIAATATEANTRKFESTSVVFGDVKDIAGLAVEAKGQGFFTAVLEAGKDATVYFNTTLHLAESLADEIQYHLVEAAYC